MATTPIHSGQTVSNIVISQGNTYAVSSGGIVDSATILAGGVLSGEAAAIFEGDIVVRGSISGGILSGSGTTEVVSSGANIVGETIGSGASATINGNVNSASGVTISGGTLTLGTGRLQTVDVAGSNGKLILGPGGGATTLASGDAFSNGNTAIVSSGGVLTSGYAVSGGKILMVGGTLRNTTVSSGGTLELSSGTTSNTSLKAGAHLIVDSGYYFNLGGSLVKVVSSGTLVDVNSGGTLGSETILAGGSTHISAGGKLSGTTTVSSGGNLYIETINSGGSATLVSGANLSGLTTVASAGRLTLTSSNVLEGHILNEGAIYGGVISGASTVLSATASGANSLTSGVSIAQGATLILGSGATGSANLVNGGTLEIQSGAQPGNNAFGSATGGTIQIDSGVAWSNANSAQYGVKSGNTLLIESGGVVSNTLIATGGTTIIASGGIIAGVQTVSSGATLVLNGTAGRGSVLLSGDGAQVTVSGTDMPTNTISGWSPNDRIDLASIPKSSITSVNTTASGITFHTTNGTYSLNVPGANRYGYTLEDDGHGNTIYTTCFAKGTHIATPEGEVAVEDLRPGDMVMTPGGAMPVKWLGHRAIRVAEQRVPEENWLVRIRAGALSDNVPSRDLLVTQEHCMVFEGKLVPARMLVNGVSVALDRTIAAYTYYHVELDNHEALWAEGALTESYLDTGNRDQFDNNSITRAFPSGVASGSTTLPLDTSRDFVEPIHAAIAARARAIPAPVHATDNADLHLITETGMRIQPHRVNGEQHVFRVPAGVATVVLASRTARPSEMVGPFVDDRRHLGVLVSDIQLFATSSTHAVETPFVDAALPGWHVIEASHHRWTNGAAVLPIDHTEEARILSVRILVKGPYRADHEVATAAA